MNNDNLSHGSHYYVGVKIETEKDRNVTKWSEVNDFPQIFVNKQEKQNNPPCLCNAKSVNVT